MKPTANLQNTTIGKLLVLHRAESTVDGKSQWLCKCECGREEVFRSDYLLRAKPNNCMCSKLMEHGLGRHQQQYQMQENLHSQQHINL